MSYVKLLIVSIILVAIVILALGVKILFNPKAKFKGHTCAFEFQEGLDKNEACTKCQLKDMADCPENEGGKIKTK